MEEKIYLRGALPTTHVSYSLLAALVRHLPLDESILKMYKYGVSAIHFDIADEIITLDPKLSYKLHELTPLPFDYHIAKNLPDETIKEVNLKEGDLICAHLESMVNWALISNRARDLNSKFGIAINVKTNWEDLVPHILRHQPNFVLVMAAEAGRSGGAFDLKTIEKIYRLRDRFPQLKINVDGGIDDLAAATLRGIGVDLLVSGSFIHSGAESRDRLTYLQGVPDNPKLISLVRQITPTVSYDASLSKILSTIENGSIGCTVVLGASGKFMGLITDYDIRVALTNRHLHEDLTAKEICNVNTFTASEDEDFWTFMLRIQGTNKMHTVVPIVSNQGDLLGIVRTQDVLFRNIDMDKSNVSF